MEVMKAGAQDFLIKGNLTRLASAVRRELAARTFLIRFVQLAGIRKI